MARGSQDAGLQNVKTMWTYAEPCAEARDVAVDCPIQYGMQRLMGSSRTLSPDVLNYLRGV